MADDGGRLRSYGTPPAASARYYPKAVSDHPPPDRARPPAGQQPYPPPQLGQCSPAYPPLQGLRGGFRDDCRPQNLYFTQPYCQQPPLGFSPLPTGHQNCRDLAGGVYEIRPSNLAQVIKAAPRQRASIACQYCRKRKIRCSGYQSDPGGKCWNCAKVKGECIFQPLSSSGSIAFISVSAVSGGVPPGTQLVGAYGQPVPSPQPRRPSSSTYLLPDAHPPVSHHVPTQSWDKLSCSYGGARTDDGSQASGHHRRRSRSRRLPLPRNASELDFPGSAPAEFSNRGRPDGIGPRSNPSHIPSPHNPMVAVLPQPTMSGGYSVSTPSGCSPASQNAASGAPTPASIAREGQAQQSKNRSIMSVSNLVG